MCLEVQGLLVKFLWNHAETNTVQTEKEIKIVVVGDFLIFRSGLKLLLESDISFKVVGEAPYGRRRIVGCKRSPPGYIPY